MKPTTTMTRSALARAARVNLETIRFYENRGLLPPPARTPSGYRQYAESDIRRLGFIRRAQELGFTLGEIKELLSLSGNPSADRSRVKALAEQRQNEIAARVRDLRRMQRALAAVSKQCSGSGPAKSCPILHALEGSGK